MYMESWIYSLFHELLFITIYFVTKIVSDLATGNPFNVNPVFLIISSSFLGWEDPMEKEMASDSRILAWRIPWTEDLMGYSPWGRKTLDTTE